MITEKDIAEAQEQVAIASMVMRHEEQQPSAMR